MVDSLIAAQEFWLYITGNKKLLKVLEESYKYVTYKYHLPWNLSHSLITMPEALLSVRPKSRNIWTKVSIFLVIRLYGTLQMPSHLWTMASSANNHTLFERKYFHYILRDELKIIVTLYLSFLTSGAEVCNNSTLHLTAHRLIIPGGCFPYFLIFSSFSWSPHHLPHAHTGILMLSCCIYVCMSSATLYLTNFEFIF